MEVVLAEIGPDLATFPTFGQLAAGAGVCPGNNASAGRQRSGRIGKGNRWLRVALVQAAWAASHTKSYLAAQYRRRAARRGKKRAIIAVAHGLLGIIYHVLKTGQPYRDLGPDYFDRRNEDSLTRHLVKRRAGVEGTLMR